MIQSKITKVIIEWEDGSQAIWDYENANIKEERGFSKDNFPDLGEPPRIYPNGQKRLLIRAWSGCKDYDSFHSDVY